MGTDEIMNTLNTAGKSGAAALVGSPHVEELRAVAVEDTRISDAVFEVVRRCSSITQRLPCASS